MSLRETALTEARRNDVEIEGGWLIETDVDDRTWDVEIWPVTSEESTD